MSLYKSILWKKQPKRKIMSLDKDHQIYEPNLQTSWTCCWYIIRQYPGSHESWHFNHPHWCRILLNHMISDDFLKRLPSASISGTGGGVFHDPPGRVQILQWSPVMQETAAFLWGMGWDVETSQPNLPLVGFDLLKFLCRLMGELGTMWFEEIPGTSTNKSKYQIYHQLEHNTMAFFLMPTRIPKHCRLLTYTPFWCPFRMKGSWLTPSAPLAPLMARKKTHSLLGAKGWGFIDFGGTDIFVHIKAG